MKNSEILLVLNSYYALKKDDSSCLPTDIAWKRRLNIRELEVAAKVINEALTDLDDKYADEEHSEVKAITDKDGNESNVRVVKSEYIDAYAKEKADLLNQDTDVKIRKFKMEDLGKKEITEKVLDTLEFMAEEDSDG